MYKFWYSTIIPTYGEHAQFVYTDTDSFIINIETEDIMKEINGPLSEHLDLSNFSHVIIHYIVIGASVMRCDLG